MFNLSISYIVPMRNEELYIEQCIDSILLNCSEGDEIIVVDNGSIDNSVLLVQKYKSVKLLIAPNANVSCVRNIGARMAKNDFLAFVDADCKLDRSWRVDALKDFANPKISVTGSKVIPADGSGWIVKAWFSQRCLDPGPVEYINSGNLLVRREVFFHLDGFSEGLVTGEDSEFCWRVRRAGYIVWNNPHMKSFHFGGPNNLASFYKQQKWHALGMFGTFNVSFFDKPLIMTSVHVFSIFIAFFYLIISLYSSFNVNNCFFIFLLVTFVPLFTVFYRIFQFKKFEYFFELLILYNVYYLARSLTMLRIIFSMKK